MSFKCFFFPFFTQNLMVVYHACTTQIAMEVSRYVLMVFVNAFRRPTFMIQYNKNAYLRHTWPGNSFLFSYFVKAYHP